MGDLAREGSLNGRLFFDENLIGLGHALRWVYKHERILISNEDLPRGARDPEVIRFCHEQNAVWVTKDWSAATADEHVRVLREEGVSAWWLRHDSGKRQSRRREQLAVAARDIEGVLDILDAGLTPVHLVSSIGRKAHQIEVPFVRPRRAATTRPMPTHARTGHDRLFD